MENPPVGVMGPASGLLALLLLTVGALFAGAFHAWRWRDGRGFWIKAVAGLALSVPAAGLLTAFVHDPRALAWRRPTGFTPEWRCAQNMLWPAGACLRTNTPPTDAREKADRP